MDDTLLPWIRMAVRLWDGFVPVTDKKMLNFVKRKRKQKKRNILEKWKRLSLRLLVAVRPPATCSVTVTSSDVVKPMSQYSTLTVVSSGGSGRCPSRGSKGAVSPVFLQWKSEADVHADEWVRFKGFQTFHGAKLPMLLPFSELSDNDSDIDLFCDSL